MYFIKTQSTEINGVQKINKEDQWDVRILTAETDCSFTVLCCSAVVSRGNQSTSKKNDKKGVGFVLF